MRPRARFESIFWGELAPSRAFPRKKGSGFRSQLPYIVSYITPTLLHSLGRQSYGIEPRHRTSVPPVRERFSFFSRLQKRGGNLREVTRRKIYSSHTTTRLPRCCQTASAMPTRTVNRCSKYTIQDLCELCPPPTLNEKRKEERKKKRKRAAVNSKGVR